MLTYKQSIKEDEGLPLTIFKAEPEQEGRSDTLALPQSDVPSVGDGREQ